MEKKFSLIDFASSTITVLQQKWPFFPNVKTGVNRSILDGFGRSWGHFASAGRAGSNGGVRFELRRKNKSPLLKSGFGQICDSQVFGQKLKNRRGRIRRNLRATPYPKVEKSHFKTLGGVAFCETRF